MQDTLRANGYSKAIDIWSIGCITATLLTNDMIFHDIPYDDDGVRCPDFSADGSAKQWDLSIIDHGPAWTTIGRKAKSFVRGCLVLDENQRLTAKQALLHPWFTNKHYAADLEAAYQRAIQDWRPKIASDNLIEFVNTTDALPANSRPEHIQRLADQVKSHHFEVLPPSMPNMLTFFQPNTLALPQKRARTPLPAISDDAEAETVQVSASPALSRCSTLHASPVRVTDSAQRHMKNTNTRRLSIEDFAPPWTQAAFPPPTSVDPQETNDSLTQSQLMLDEPPSMNLTLQETKDDIADGRRVRFADTRICDTASLDVFGAPAAHAYPRKKVCL